MNLAQLFPNRCHRRCSLELVLQLCRSLRRYCCATPNDRFSFYRAWTPAAHERPA